ncbi:MAG: hypothetical protein A2Y56_09100 [Candidatus Aminicenantes bacterium RBG_13_63_10]|nr:MAG: hypothetical protein A2Y56_09100 [Candidatus Aminicenantes bacterium RBG_13_63_10]
MVLSMPRKVFRALSLTLGVVLAIPLGKGEVYYPWKETAVGALHAPAWAGLVLAPHPGAVFAFQLRVEKKDRPLKTENEKSAAEGQDFFYLVSEVGPHSPDGQYARVAFDMSLPFGLGKNTPILIKPSRSRDTLTMEWCRVNENLVIGCVTGPADIDLQLIHYLPWESKGRYRILSDGRVQGEVREPKACHYLFWSDRQGLPQSSGPEADRLAVSFSMKKERSVYFAAGAMEDTKLLSNRVYRYQNRKAISNILQEEKDRYQRKRVKVSGRDQRLAESITNNLFWMTLYQPDHHRLYTPAGRSWIFPRPDGQPDHWTIFEWDSFFNALEAAVESEKHAKDIVRAVLDTQYPNGNIPNWRSRSSGTPDRSQPPVGAYVVLKLFQRFGDLAFLKSCYPALKSWHAFWKAKKPNGQARRDGNGDGLLEWGSDRVLLAESMPPWEKDADGKQRAMWESGQDDLPNWDEAGFSEAAGTMTMNCLDLNSLYALDAWCLAQMANILNLRQDQERYQAEYEQMRSLINRLLWNDREKFYFDRHWDGKFSARKAASNFYPLLARIPDERHALQMQKHLLNPREFWGDFILPTISRDDPAFKDQQYWRGTIWPPTNYLVYQGLKAYGFDTVASEFARKSAALFLRSWSNFQLCPENFDSRTGEAGGQRYQSWGPLFSLIAIEDYLDFTPWEGFRFGMIKPERRSSVDRLAVQGRHYGVFVSAKEIRLEEEGREILTIDGGAVIRHFLYSDSEVSFDISSLEPREVKIRFLKEGKYQFLFNSQVKRVFRGKSLSFDIPEGLHNILVLLLSEQK